MATSSEAGTLVVHRVESRVLRDHEELDGSHMSIAYRLDVSVPLLVRALAGSASCEAGSR